MSNSFTCACGKRIKVADSLAGRKVRCPACGAVNRIPAVLPPGGGPPDDPPTVVPSAPGPVEWLPADPPGPVVPAAEVQFPWQVVPGGLDPPAAPAGFPVSFEQRPGAGKEAAVEELPAEPGPVEAPALPGIEDKAPIESPAVRRRTLREPWYYGFLVVYAYVVIGLAVLQFAGVLALTIVALALTESRSQVLVALASLFPLGASFAWLLGAHLIGAPILLAVDAARNLRALRRH